jgi:UDP-3-O-[3-hydroxymyristoyl] glucosamine N-acyltransferase
MLDEMSTGKKMTVAQIAALVAGEVQGDGGVEITDVASLTHAHAGALSFLGDQRFREAALAAPAGALLVSAALPVAVPQIIVAEPYQAFVKVMNTLIVPEQPPAGVHPTAVVSADAELGEGVHVGAMAVIGPGVRIGAGAAVQAGCVVGAGCAVGAGSVLYPRVVLYPGVRIGARVLIHAGAVIGADGFGYVLTPSGHLKKPQVGTVVIEDEVEIGANCTIDRAMLDQTVVGAGSKLDNLVHLAHNVRVGRRCIILAGTDVGGSVVIGDGAIVSGNVTVKDNIVIGPGAVVVGHSGVADDVAAGETVFGYPAMPFSLAKRVYSRFKQLPELFTRVRKLEKIIAPKGPREGD